MILTDIIASFAVAVLAGMGVGGGGLLVIYLTLIRNMEQLQAQGINLLFFIASALAALLINLRHREFNFRRLTIIALPGIAFAIIGALTARSVSPMLIRRCFGGLLFISGFSCLIRNLSKRKNRRT